MNNWVCENGAVFIVVHDCQTGNEIMINPRAIESIHGSRIFFQGYAYEVKESYAEIKDAMIKGLGMIVEKV